MNRTHSLSLITLVLAGCMSSPPSERHAGIYAVLDPATGITYNVPMRHTLSSNLYPMPLSGATRASTTKDLDTYVFGARESMGAAQNAVAVVASVGALGAAVPLRHVPERTALVEPARAPLSASRAQRELNEVAPSSPDPSQSIKLKLDTEFASAKRLVRFALGAASLGPIGKLAIAELLPWAKQAEKVHVKGGADSSGNVGRNRELAIARAMVVSSAFVSAGVDRDKISTSFCTDCYVASNDTEHGRRSNRRVDVELVLKKELFAQLPPPVHAPETPSSSPPIHAASFRTR